jgi:hypothetical protein
MVGMCGLGLDVQFAATQISVLGTVSRDAALLACF